MTSITAFRLGIIFSEIVALADNNCIKWDTDEQEEAVKESILAVIKEMKDDQYTEMVEDVDGRQGIH